MFEELVKRLRYLSGTDNLAEFDEAADAIETLIGKVKYLIKRCDMADKNCSEAVHLGAMWKEAALERMPRWIPVTETMPPLGDRILITDGMGVWEGFLSSSSGFMRNAAFSIKDVYNTEITHWMPLPEPPKEET